MKYLSQLGIGKSQAAHEKLQDSYAWHQKLWELFPGHDGESRNFLFRVDDARAYFSAFVLSSEEPKVPDWGNIETKSVADTFLDHSRYRFQLKANPTMRRSSDKRRLGIYSEDKLRSWICRKADQNGFEVETDALAVGGPQDVVFVKDGKRGKHVGVDFQGICCVTDRTAFRNAFEKGIGPAKSFGFGLLMLQPIS